jgi:hypothetical protein
MPGATCIGAVGALSRERSGLAGCNVSALIEAGMSAQTDPRRAAAVDVVPKYYYRRALTVRELMPALAAGGIVPAAYFASETGANNFPRLPVRENEPVFVWFALHADQAEYQRRVAALNDSTRWRESVAPALRHLLKTPPQTLRLAPTPRSLLHA